MRNFTLAFCLLICSYHSSAQKINYENSLAIAKEKAAKQSKILFLYITIPRSANVPQKNLDIDFPEVADIYNTNFINYKGDVSDTAIARIRREYSINKFPALVFFDTKGSILSKEFGLHNKSNKYIEFANNAIRLSNEKSLSDYDEEYKRGNVDKMFLKQYILKRMQIGSYNNAALIEEYVELMKISDLKNYDEVLFILKAGPIINGKAYKLTHIYNLKDSVYKAEDLATRIAINNVIINNSMSAAITKKSFLDANAVSDYVRNSWGKDYKEGHKKATLKLLQYYKAVKDTLNFLRQASFYYDQYYMTLSKDSVIKKSAENFELVKKRATEQAKLDGKNTFKITVPVSGGNNVASELNNIAYDFYLTGTKNNNYLLKAVLWSKRSLELDQVYAFYDTLAHLLYRLDFYAEAEINQTKAIELAKFKKIDTEFLEIELEKIKNRTL